MVKLLYKKLLSYSSQPFKLSNKKSVRFSLNFLSARVPVYFCQILLFFSGK